MVFVMKLAAVAQKYQSKPKKEWTETALKPAVVESEKNNVLDSKNSFCSLFDLLVKSF